MIFILIQIKTILKFWTIFIAVVSLTCAIPFHAHGQDRFFEPLSIESRFYSIRDNNNTQMSLSGVGLTYCHAIVEKIYKRKVVYNLLIPMQYVSNYSLEENKFNAYSIGTAFKVDIATLNEDSKWFFTNSLGMDFFLLKKQIQNLIPELFCIK